MLRIIVNMPPDPGLAARVCIVDGSHTISDDWGAASVDPKLAARAGNKSADPLRPAGNVPLGRYELVARGPAPADTEAEYGRTVLLFEPVGGQALDAEAYGRLALLAYSGRMAPNARLRRTQGGLRLTTRAIEYLLVGLGADTPVDLLVEPYAPRPWWAFWRKRIVHPPLSDRAPQFDAPPLDEASLMAELIKKAVRRSRASPLRDEDERERRWDRDTSTSSSDTPEYRGRGGEGGGAGASSGWSEAPAAGRGPGVDAAGRIATAAGIAGVAAVAAATAMAAREQTEAASGSASNAGNSDSTTSGSSPPDVDSTTNASDGGSSSSDSNDSGWSSSGTSY